MDVCRKEDQDQTQDQNQNQDQDQTQDQDQDEDQDEKPANSICEEEGDNSSKELGQTAHYCSRVLIQQQW